MRKKTIDHSAKEKACEWREQSPFSLIFKGGDILGDGEIPPEIALSGEGLRKLWPRMAGLHYGPSCGGPAPDSAGRHQSQTI